MEAAQLLVHCCELTRIDATLLNAYEALLSAPEQERLHAYKDPSARRTFLVGRALLRSQLAQLVQMPARQLQFTRDSNNKPQLQTPASPWQFNLSHSGAWVVLALSNAGAVGVDVEQHLRPSRLEAISARFFSEAEHAALLALPELARRQRFFELWTLKESYVKALGRGIATALAGTDIAYANPGAITLQLSGAARCQGTVHSWHYQLSADYSLALASITDSEATPAPPRLFDTIALGGSAQNLALPPHLHGIGLPS
jgi:4'-phosphopantetheinyl transferase